MNLVQQALLLEKQGFRIMPMKGKAQPLVEGFGADDPDFTCDPSEFAPPATHIGLLCGPCPALGEDWLLCVDFDGEFGEVPELMAFWNALGTPEPTMASHDGAHLFYRVSPGPERDRLKQWTDVFATKAATGCAVDLKWAGGYAAESWDWDSDTNPLELVDALQYLSPAAMRALLASPRAAAAPARERTSARPEEWPSIFDFDAVYAAAGAWLEKEAPVAIDGQGGSNTLYAVAARLVGDYGLPEDAALDLLEDHYNGRCEPEWTYDELVHKVQDASSKAEVTWDAARAATYAKNPTAMALVLPERALPTPPVLAPPVPAELTMSEKEEALITWNAHLVRTAKGEIKNCVFNTVYTFDVNPIWSHTFGYDEFYQTVVFLHDHQDDFVSARAGDPLSDDHVTGLRAWFSRLVHEPSDHEMRAALQKISRKRPIHAVRQYLESLRGRWDGLDRNLVHYLGAEPTEYQLACCAKTLRAAVARIMVPGEKADTMLILEGEQGWKKSSFIRALCPDVRWFYEVASRDVGNKDFLQDALGKWLAEIPEVDQLIASRDESELKALLSRRWDRYRPSYGRSSLDFARQLIFWGTTNKSKYLRDETGNRRYWPIKCCAVGPILDGKVCDDRDQLWAQAVAEYDAFIASGRDEAHPGRWWFSPGEAGVARTEAEERLEQDPWEEMLEPWLAQQHEAKTPFTALEAMAQLPGAVPGAQLEQRHLNRMSKVLRKLGYDHRQRRIAGRKAWYWRPMGSDY